MGHEHKEAAMSALGYEHKKSSRFAASASFLWGLSDTNMCVMISKE